MLHKSFVDSVSGKKAHADGKWLHCIGNKPVHVGDRVFTDGNVIFGNFFEPQQPHLFNRTIINGIPILVNDQLIFVDLNGKSHDLNIYFNIRDYLNKSADFRLLNNSKKCVFPHQKDFFIIDSSFSNNADTFAVAAPIFNYPDDMPLLRDDLYITDAPIFHNNDIVSDYSQMLKNAADSVIDSTDVSSNESSIWCEISVFDAFIDSLDNFQIFASIDALRFGNPMPPDDFSSNPNDWIMQSYCKKSFLFTNNDYSILSTFSRSTNFEDVSTITENSPILNGNVSLPNNWHLHFVISFPFDDDKEYADDVPIFISVFDSNNQLRLKLTNYCQDCGYDLRVFPLNNNKFLVSSFYKFNDENNEWDVFPAVVNSDGSFVDFIYSKKTPVFAAFNFRFCKVNDIDTFKRFFRSSLYDFNKKILQSN